MKMQLLKFAALIALVFALSPATAVDTRPIGVFDSGIGGLTILEKLLSHPGLAGERFTYLGDQANMPYGNYAAAGKSAYLRELVIKDALFLVSDGAFASGADARPEIRKNPAKIIVIACNTATAYGLKPIQSTFAGAGFRQQVIGVINAGVRSALDRLAGELAQSPLSIGILATPGTIASGAYQRTIREECAQRGVKNEVAIFAQGCPGLADAIELGTADADAIARENLTALIRQHRKAGAPPLKAVILGCTHYPFLLATLEKTRAEFGESFIFVDPAVGTADECWQALKASDMLAGRSADANEVTFYASVPSGEVAPGNLAADGTLATAFKYGRNVGQDEVTTKFVPFRSGTVDPASLKRLMKLLPRTAKALAE